MDSATSSLGVRPSFKAILGLAHQMIRQIENCFDRANSLQCQ